MITKLKRNPKFDVPYHDTYVFEFDNVDAYIAFVKELSTWSGIVRLQSSITAMKYTGYFTVDRYVVPADFLHQITQKKLSL